MKTSVLTNLTKLLYFQWVDGWMGGLNEPTAIYRLKRVTRLKLTRCVLIHYSKPKTFFPSTKI